MINYYSSEEINSIYARMSALRWRINSSDDSDNFKKGKQLMFDDILKDFEAERQKYIQCQITVREEIFTNKFTLDELGQLANFK
ncbi:MAG: hypothetical protein AABX93_01760 [Nanoarchaeota archaeon]